jgi:hypothetical protein
MRRILLAMMMTLFMVLLVGCGGGGEGNSKKEVLKNMPEMNTSEKERFKTYAPNLRGGVFIESAEVDFNKAKIVYETFAEYKKRKGDNTKITEDSYNQYWSTGDAINKVLMEEPVRLLREFPELSAVEMTITFNDKTYSVSIDRFTVEDYFDVDLTEIHKDSSNELWRKKIVDPYIYNEKERAKYAKEFIKTS